MIRQILFYLFLCFLSCQQVLAQQADTITPVKQDTAKTIATLKDSLHIIQDSILADTAAIGDSIRIKDSLLKAARAKAIADSLAVVKKNAGVQRFTGTIKQYKGQEYLFYSLIFMLIFYAVLKLLFPKYFTDLLRVYFRTTLKQTQVREQLLQTPLPSLLLNGFFIVAGGMYAGFLAEHFRVAPKLDFWQLWLYSSILLSIIYMMKYAGVWIAGWLFNLTDAASSYIFIVFMTNKIIGIIVLPFLVLLAFGDEKIYPAALIISITLVACLFLYRLYLSFGIVRNQSRLNLLHLFLYLSAFEALPLLILFKWVVAFLK